MKDVLTTLKNLRRIKLTHHERAVLSERLTEYRSFKPVRVNEKSKVSSDTWFLGIFQKRSVSVVAGLLIAVTLGGSTAYGAELSLPGDVLYSVKTRVTEPIRGAFAFTLESQAEWEARLAERRLEEAQILTTQGTLSVEQQTALETRFAYHKEQAEEKRNRIKERNPALAVELQTRFDASVDAHLAVLSGLQAYSPSVAALSTDETVDVTGESANGTSLATRSFIAEEDAPRPVFNVGGTVEVSVTDAATTSEKAAHQLQEAARESIAESEKLLERIKPKLEKEVYLRAEAEIDRAVLMYAEGEAQLKEGSYVQAQASFTQVIRSMKHFTVALKAWVQGQVRFMFILEPEIPVHDAPLPVDIEGGIGDGAVPLEIEDEVVPVDEIIRPLPSEKEVESDIKTDNTLRPQL